MIDMNLSIIVFFVKLFTKESQIKKIKQEKLLLGTIDSLFTRYYYKNNHIQQIIMHWTP